MKMPEPTNYAAAAQAKLDDLARIEAEAKSWKHVGVAFGFYPFDWHIKPEWGPIIHSINLGPFALTFIF